MKKKMTTPTKTTEIRPDTEDVFVVLYRSRGQEMKQEVAQFKTTKRHFHPRIGWELKDCVSMGTPQQFRFCRIEEITEKYPYFAVQISDS